jgi:hypothetical protein
MIGSFAFADAGLDWLLHDACRITQAGQGAEGAPKRRLTRTKMSLSVAGYVKK